MTPIQQDTINALVTANSSLVKAFTRGELGEFVRTLTLIEIIVKNSRERLSNRTVLDLDAANDEEL